MNEKAIAIAKKLKALADRGEGGERTSAEALLKKLMKQHGITESDLDDEKLEMHWFRVRPEQKELFCQIARSIRVACDFYGSRAKPGKIAVKLSAVDALDLHAMFAWYWKAYKEEEHTFFVAFVCKHNLLSKEKLPDDFEPSELEIQRAIRAMKMQSGIQEKPFRKRLTEG